MGVDEVGRGPLAGPVVAACVFFSAPVSRLSRLGIADSKSLSSDRRDELSRLIHTEADHVSLGWSSVDEVNELNVRQATFLAMNRALQQLPPFLMRDSRLCVAVDGRDKIPGVEIQQRTVVGGDRTVLSVAAASIVAKVARDSYMEKLDALFPGYGFAKHKGYGTEEHRNAILRLGLSPHHRPLFCRKLLTQAKSR
ncbi:MAG: ribonuclease HII [Nitrospirae bacterium]|uniref:Ribonuclease n=1 Tax=Leptospirillum ferrodiazotrophum TaxID=412449 RepID=C6HV29_9BACT|nr:MAG: Ribonuclease HII [Leptospirillum ferrodiazotrophum]MCL5954071.1 ribonuclease HII [Nitrospirota bacterium]